ncbi:MAG: hypothetical protein IKW49_01680 [Opitutales bacterium]|nr:hypothetical protein [Opitutales bacterium]
MNNNLLPFYKVKAELGVSTKVLEFILLKESIKPTVQLGRLRLYSPSCVERIKACIS